MNTIGLENSVDQLTDQLTIKLGEMHATQISMLREFKRIADALERMAPPTPKAKRKKDLG